MDGRPPLRPTCRDDFEIAIICALPLEYDAVIATLDGYWNDDGDHYGKVDRDQNTYTTGWIGQHNVVLALLASMGKVHATSVATSFSLSFGHIKLAFLVGICGAVPQISDGTEIMLGDVIISQKVLQYDFVRRYSDKSELKDKLAMDLLGQSHNAHRYMATMQTSRYRELLPQRTLACLRAVQEVYTEKYRSPQSGDNRLFSSSYRHKHQTSAGCDTCDRCIAPLYPVCDTALKSTCEELGCDERHLVRRGRLSDASPVVHWGTMASADTVMKSAFDRDAIADCHGIIGFEMEGAGICSAFPCIITKGVCDYADSHKSKKWQNYAALSAACVMKVLLKWYPQTDQRSKAAVSMGGGEIASALETKHLAIKKSQMVRENVVARLQEQNEDLQIQIRGLKALLHAQRELPPQVPSRDLVSINDALGGTYSFPLTFVDSLEFFLVILKHKFKDVGLRKIERGEWLLQNQRTKHVLDLNKPWKAVIKPGQILDMSMIFKKRNTLSTQCPWCKIENESDAQDQYIKCIQCLGKYRRIEEVYDIVGAPDIESLQHDTGNPPFSTSYPSGSSNSHSIPAKDRVFHDAEEDIHLYTRVQMIDVNFRINQPADGNSKKRTLQIKVTSQDFKNIAKLTQKLTRVNLFPANDFLDAINEHYEKLSEPTTAHSNDFLYAIIEHYEKLSEPTTAYSSLYPAVVEYWSCHKCGMEWNIQLYDKCLNYKCWHERCHMCRIEYM